MKDRYFSHDQNALSDNKIAELRGTYRMEGYGVYWAIVEALSREPDLTLPLTERRAAAFQVSLNPTFDMMQFIRDCIEIGLFETDGERFWSNSLQRRMQAVFETSRRNREAAMKRWGKQPKAPPKSLPPEPAESYEDACDPEWKRVTDAYMAQIGMLPMGKAGEILFSYYEDLGADAMIVAIECTNSAQPNNPYAYLKAILDAFADKNVHSREEALACCNDFDRKQGKRKGMIIPDTTGTYTYNDSDDGDVKWLV